MSDSCFVPVDVCILRVARLTSAGAPITGAGQGYITDASQQIAIGLTLETGSEFTHKNGCGAIKAYSKKPDKIKASTVTLDLCQLDFELMSLLCDGTLWSSGGNGIGWQPPLAAAGEPDPVYLEAWSKAWIDTNQAVPAFTAPDGAYIKFVLPFVKCVQQPFTLKEGPTIIQVSGVGSENTQATANGPWNDAPAAVAGTGGVTAVYGVYLDDAIPTADCGFASVPTGS